MILHTGMRTDIPAFYSEWFPSQVTRYSLSPEVVDLLAFCTKIEKIFVYN